MRRPGYTDIHEQFTSMHPYCIHDGRPHTSHLTPHGLDVNEHVTPTIHRNSIEAVTALAGTQPTLQLLEFKSLVPGFSVFSIVCRHVLAKKNLSAYRIDNTMEKSDENQLE